MEVTNPFDFYFFGEHAAVNYSGSWHDTKLATATFGLYFPTLSEDMTLPGMAILGDSNFVNNIGVMHGKIIRGRKENEHFDIPNIASIAELDLALQSIMPSEGQSAEWGVRAIKGPFQRLKVPLLADAQKRLRFLSICCYLFNFRTRNVGLNQIRTT